MLYEKPKILVETKRVDTENSPDFGQSPLRKAFGIINEEEQQQQNLGDSNVTASPHKKPRPTEMAPKLPGSSEF